jgi:hypothetical protein
MKYTLKKPDGTEVTLTRDQLTIGYNTREINTAWPAKEQGTTEWLRVGVLLGVEPPGLQPGFPSEAPPSEASAPSPGATGAVPASLRRRYQDAYLTARTITAVGATVKVLAFVVGGLVALVGLAAGSQSTQFAIGGVILGVILAFPFYVFGVLVSAQGQILKATLDTAVNSSQLLTKDEMRQIMSLQ